MAERGTPVGSLYYETTLETAGLITAQRKIEQALKQAGDAGDTLQTRLTKSASAVGAAMQQIGAEAAAAKMRKAADAAAAAGGAFDGAAEQIKSTGDAAAAASGRFTDAAGRLREANGQFVKTKEDAAGAGEGLKKVGDEADKAGEGLKKTTQTTEQLSHQMRQVAPQITDVVTQLASGADPLTVLIQQGGQLKDMFGGVKEAAIAVGRYIAGMVTPVTVAVTALGLIGYALHKGAEESEAFEKAIALTGGAAGITEGQFNSLAASISDATNTTIGSAREALQQLVSDGKLSGDALVSAATGVERMAKATGGDVSALASKFSEAMKDPVSWALKMNEQVRFLTPELYRQAKALQDVGENGKATTLVFDALNTKLSDTKREVGYVENAWNSLKRAASDGINFVLSWGRNGTPDDMLAQAEAELARLKGPAPFQGATGAVAAVKNAADGGETLKGMIADQEALVASLRATKKLSEDVAKATGERTQREQDGLKWAQMAEASLTTRARLAKELAAANALADKTGASPEERARVLASIRERYAGVVAEDQALSRARLAETLANSRRIESATAAGIQRAGEFMEAQHQAGLASDQAYYDTRRSLIAQDVQNQIAAIDTEAKAVAAQKINAKDATDRARQLMEQQTQLRDLAAQRAEVEASGLQRVALLEIQQLERARQLRDQRNQTQLTTLQIRAETTGNPEDQAKAIRRQAELQVEAQNEAAQRDLENWQTYADNKIAITQRMEQQIQDLQSASVLAQIAVAQNFTGQMLGVLQKGGKERTALGKAMFLADKALAVASIILNTEMGAMKAVGQMGPFGIPMATFIRAQGYASAGLVAGLAVADAFGGGRQYGGPVSADSMYRVNETGRPEMFTASNGAQYLLPTGGGRVTSAAEMASGGVAPTVIINNNGAPVSVQSSSWDAKQQRMVIDLAAQEVGNQFRSNTGPAWSGLRAGSNVQPRL